VFQGDCRVAMPSVISYICRGVIIHVCGTRNEGFRFVTVIGIRVLKTMEIRRLPGNGAWTGKVRHDSIWLSRRVATPQGLCRQQSGFWNTAARYV